MTNACLTVLGRCAVLLLCVGTLSCAVQRTEEAAPAFTGLKTRIETPLFRETAAFYTDLLGLEVLDAWEDAGDRGVILGLGGAQDTGAFLEIAHADAAAHAAISLQFRVNDLSAVAARLRGRWDFRGPEKRPWGSTYLYLRDPSGVRVIVYEGDL